MANTDYPRGFHPVAKFDGSPFTGLIRSAGASDTSDIFLFDHVKYVSGLLTACTLDADVVAGVCVGFGRNPGGMHGGANVGPFNPRDLEEKFYDTSATTNTEYVIYFVPARNVLFEGQTDGTETPPVLEGTSYDITFTAGSAVTGISANEIKGGTAAGAATDGVALISPVTRPGNDVSADNADWIVKFNSPL